MDDELTKFIKGAPPGRRVKKLARYAKLVLGCYDLGWTYRAIAGQLRRKHRLSVAPSTLWEFVRQHRPGAAPASNTIHLSAATVTEPKQASAPAISQPQPPAPAKTSSPTPATTPSPKPTPRKPRFNLDT
jgi:hypothetical protein